MVYSIHDAVTIPQSNVCDSEETIFLQHDPVVAYKATDEHLNYFKIKQRSTATIENITENNDREHNVQL